MSHLFISHFLRCLRRFICDEGGLTFQHLVEKLGRDDFLDVRNSEGKTPLHEAAQFARFESVQYLLDHGCDVNALKRADWTPLMLAATRAGEEASKVKRRTKLA